MTPIPLTTSRLDMGAGGTDGIGIIDIRIIPRGNE
jgi:hypothetical protein